MACVSTLLLAVDSGPFQAAAFAQARDYRLDIPAGRLTEGLSRLSAATGISVGAAGPIPAIRVKAVKGRMTAEQALHLLLSGSGWRAVKTGPLAYRLERSPARPPSQPRTIVKAPPAEGMPNAEPVDIVVTAQKREQPLSSLPLSLSIVSINPGRAGIAVPSSHDVALATEGLALTNLGPGRNRQFIRGVADSPFNGPSQSTVAIQLDDARITYDAPDPDLRLIDVERVELLKGPQGPLYGSGALGGIYRIVTNRPDPDISTGHVRIVGEAVEHGDIGGGGDVLVNLPIVPGKLAMRGLAYSFRTPGWIDNQGRKPNANSAAIDGGRVALRWLPAYGWSVDLGAVMQDINVRDSQYVLASDDTLSRINPIAEPNDNDFRAFHATIEGRVGGLKLLSATSYVRHAVDYTLDATAAGSIWNRSGAVRFQDDRAYTILNQELRLSPANSERWLAGLSYLRAESRSTGTLLDMTGATTPIERLNRNTTEISIFAEAVQPIFETVKATLGVRVSHTTNDDESIEGSTRKSQRIGKVIASPSVSLAWQPSEGQLVYLRYARAMRPGGLSPSGAGTESRFDSDELSTFDLGTRANFGRVRIAASLYYTDWLSIQSDYLLNSGLVGTRNAGDGRIIGGEASIAWQVLDTVDLAAGINLQDATLVRATDGIELDDYRLPVAPNMTGRLALSHRFDLNDWHGRATVQANYVGRARLALDDDLDRRMGNYAVVALHAAIARAGWAFTGRIDNLFDIKGDSFAFGNPFSIRNGPQYTPLRPRALTLSLGYSW